VFEIGNSLREARLRRRIELAQAEQATKIRGKYLRALEEERFDLLPAETYVKGFLRTYAAYLGLDAQLYVDEFTSRFVTGDEREPRRRRTPRDRRSRRLETMIVAAVLVTIAVVTVVVIGAWTSSGNHAVPPRVPPAKPKPVRAAVPVPGLAIAALHGSSYVAVHRGGAAGPVLFQGTVGRGEPQTFAGTRFWVNVSSPENLVIRVRGKRIKLAGYRPRVITVTPTSWRAG
jgi:cytoskeleton protein RodZ